MLTQDLIHAVEAKWEGMADRTLSEIRRDPKLPHMGKLPEAELREWARRILTSLPSWPASLDDEKLAARYEHLGEARFRESIPLHEAIRGLHHLKCRLIEFIRQESQPQTALDLYGELEAEHRTCMYFDRLLYHLARGYELARDRTRAAA